MKREEPSGDHRDAITAAFAKYVAISIRPLCIAETTTLLKILLNVSSGAIKPIFTGKAPEKRRGTGATVRRK